MRTETGILRTSLIGILVVAALGVGFGLASGSSAILFDGVFSLVDAAMSLVSITVANLIAQSASGTLSQRLSRRFTMGFWHFEPMVIALNAAILLTLGGYALFSAAQALLEGGRPMSFGPAIIYAVMIVILSAGFGWAEHRANRSIRSELVAMDIRSWVMGGGISFALLIAFAIGWAIQGTRHAWMIPYIDPAVLVVVCLLLLPVPIMTLRRALTELAFMTPPDLHAHVDRVAERITAEEGFVGHRAYMARIGRATQIELYFIVPPDLPARRLEEWDALRDRIGAALGDANPHRWLTIAFTTDPERAGDVTPPDPET